MHHFLNKKNRNRFNLSILAKKTRQILWNSLILIIKIINKSLVNNKIQKS